MRKILSFIVLLVISSTLSFGQNLGVVPSTILQDQKGENQNLEQYLNKNVASNAKAQIWYSNMATSSQWVVAKLANQSANILNQWELKADTGAFSANWDNYVGPYMGSTTPLQGVFYFDGISNLVAANYGTTNTTLTNAVAINTTGHPTVNIKFYQLYKAYNADSTLLEVSTDNINWHSIMVNPEITVGSANTYAYGWKEFSLTQWAGNHAQVWIRFRFYAPASTTSGAQYGGGYGWAIDDVELFDPANNNILVTRTTLYDGYTQVPSGLGMPMYYDADFMNLGGMTQTHVKLHGVEITTHADSISSDTTLAPGESLVDWSINNYFFTPPTTQGTYKVMAYISSDSIPFLLAQDTFDIKVVCDTCMHSRDNNTYVSSRWAGTTGVLCDPYTAANRFQVNQDKEVYSVSCVVNNASKVGSKIKAVLYKYFAATGTRTIVAQSANYYLTAANIPTGPMVNPPSVNLHYTAPYTMQKDSMYWVGIQVYGGQDTVKLATDNTGIPQFTQTSLYYDPTAGTWYIWGSGNVPAVMIRSGFNLNYPFDNGPLIIGINETAKTVTSFSCMPNPANNTTQISYELKNNEQVSIIITDITGRTVQTLNQGVQAQGNYAIDVNLTNLTSGTYFYTLKTPTAQVTEKLIIVKR